MWARRFQSEELATIGQLRDQAIGLIQMIETAQSEADELLKSNDFAGLNRQAMASRHREKCNASIPLQFYIMRHVNERRLSLGREVSTKDGKRVYST